MGPSNKKPVKPEALFLAVKNPDVLFKAWISVRDKGIKSKSAETRDEINAFSTEAARRLRKIATQLKAGKFQFVPAKGILIKKKAKSSKRPVVVAPIESRIVQRAILDVLQAVPAIKSILHEGYNFGGVEGTEFGVPAAVAKAVISSKKTDYFIRTDIKSFFVDIPRSIALDRILKHSNDPLFDALLHSAAKTELRDVQNYEEEERALFPLWEDGVAQGSCLSPLLCNFLLSEFDRQMNARDIVCIRYIDDFILFAKSESAARAALAGAMKLLGALGLDAYDPFSGRVEDAEKAEHGRTDTNEITFLGCELRRDRVRPSRANQVRLRKKIDDLFSASLKAASNPSAAVKSENNYADAIRIASETVKGWGNTYSFCSDDNLMKNLDLELANIFDDFNKEMRARIARMSPIDKRRALGFFALEDCNRDDREISARSLVKV